MIHSEYSYFQAFAGGALIGLASLLAMLTTGAIPGISGLFSRLFRWPLGNGAWRYVFFAGLLTGAGLMISGIDSAAAYRPVRSLAAAAIAGVLVGFGTRLGGGCTSGHGICGIGLGSSGSVVATAIFMAAAIATVLALHHSTFAALP